MKINHQKSVEASAWADGNSIQLRIGPHRFTADESEALDLATQIVAAIDTVKAGGKAAAGRVAPLSRGRK